MKICPVHNVDGPSQTTIPRQLQLVELHNQNKYKFKSPRLRYKIHGAKDRQVKRDNRFRGLLQRSRGTELTGESSGCGGKWAAREQFLWGWGGHSTTGELRWRNSADASESHLHGRF